LVEELSLLGCGAVDSWVRHSQHIAESCHSHSQK